MPRGVDRQGIFRDGAHRLIANRREAGALRRQERGVLNELQSLGTVRRLRHPALPSVALRALLGSVAFGCALTGASASAQTSASSPQAEAPPPIDPDAPLPPLAPIGDDPFGDLDPNAPLAELPAVPGLPEVAWPDPAAPIPPLQPLTPPQLANEGAVSNLPGSAEDPLVAQLPPPVDGSRAAEAGEVVPIPPAVKLAPPSDAPTLDADETQTAVAPIGETRRYSVAVQGFADLPEEDWLEERFDELSALRAADGDSANGAQINRRLREDIELATQLLRNAGYYDAEVAAEVRRSGDRWQIVLNSEAGRQYIYREVTVAGLDAAGEAESSRLRPAFGNPIGDPIAVGDPIDADILIGSQKNLRYEMRETGYPFAEIGEETVVVDHETFDGTLNQPVTPGARLRFGEIIADDGGLLGSRHLQQIARFSPGEWYRASSVEDLRRALIATGLVSSVEIAPRAAIDGETVNLNVGITPGPQRTLAGLLGYSTGQGLRAEASWEHRNLFPPEGALILRGIIGTREQLASVTFRRNNWRERDRVLTAQALVSNIESDAFTAQAIHLSGRIERPSTLIYQKIWSWAVGAEVLGTDELAFVPALNGEAKRRYVIAGAFGLVSYDRSNSLLDPTRGFRLTARLAPEISFLQGTFGYVRGQLDGTYYRPINDRIVLAGRARVAGIVGASRDDIAPSRRLYAGGGGSVRGYGYQRIGPLAPNGRPIGGTSLIEVAAEARIRAFGNFSIVPFIDAGNVYPTALPSFSDLGEMRFGAGIGVRYATNFGPIRVDLGTPLNPRPGDSRIAVYVSLGQAF